ncbi:hypothetical protein LJ707_16405 [Mucilaginibacter sp. UR6-1]|uniref:hypothetical protein n=1 Tax=Mucilaginibacter sp. UR6-1 TaxID=1435643 RepID=UPI001E5E8ACE|nr:hypothetical protein [Mucilaginibacter sp. UR6-1]MCC8410526.1 hypothetical protein [Mucilaginibacter sp. UR6-1]
MPRVIAGKKVLFIMMLFAAQFCKAQQITRYNPDTIKTIVLDSVININSHKLNVQDFIDAVTSDTSFYKAFQSMRQYSYTAENSIYTYDKKDRVNGRIYRKMNYSRVNGKPNTQYIAKSDSGKVFKKNGRYELYTVEMFDYLFANTYNKPLASPSNNSKGDGSKNASYKDKLKTLIFRPGTKVSGIPFISGKTEIFSPELKQFYYYQFARGTYLDSIPVYRFKVIRKPSTAPGDVMINEMTTIFDTRTLQIMGRYIDMSFSNMFVSFKVRMNIEMNNFNGELLPVKVSYQGNWDVPLHKEERASVLITHTGYRHND